MQSKEEEEEPLILRLTARLVSVQKRVEKFQQSDEVVEVVYFLLCAYLTSALPEPIGSRPCNPRRTGVEVGARCKGSS